MLFPETIGFIGQIQHEAEMLLEDAKRTQL